MIDGDSRQIWLQTVYEKKMAGHSKQHATKPKLTFGLLGTRWERLGSLLLATLPKGEVGSFVERKRGKGPLHKNQCAMHCAISYCMAWR